MRSSDAPLLNRIVAALPKDVRRALAIIRQVAESRGTAAYLVGGCVRDALLGVSSGDVDVSVEGDAPTIAAEVANRAGLPTPVVHPTFRTATVRVGEHSIDLITARREAYAAPGALPTVTPSTIADDLARRDFTINAMAVALTGDARGTLLDPHGGLADLERGLLRTLHTHSFRDDATRLLRAARYAGRFGFQLEEATLAHALRDSEYLSTISPARVRHEFERIFAESEPERALAVVRALEADHALLPDLRVSEAVLGAYRHWWERGASAHETPWLLPLVDASGNLVSAYADRFALTHRERDAAHSVAMVGAQAAGWSASLVQSISVPPSATLTLDGIPLAAIEAWLCRYPDSTSSALLERYLREYRSVRPLLASADLQAMGVPASPLFGQVVRQLRALRIDHPAATVDDERALVQHMLAEHARGR